MSVKISGQVWELDLDPMDKLVLLALSDHADHEGQSVKPGNALLCAKTGLSEKTIGVKIAKFLELGILEPVETTTGRGNIREFAVELSSAERHPYFIEKDRRKVERASTNQSSKRSNLKPQKVELDAVKVELDGFAYKEHEPSEPSIEPSEREKAPRSAVSEPADTDNLFATIKSLTGFEPIDLKGEQKLWQVAEQIRGGKITSADLRAYAATRTKSAPKIQYLYEDVCQWKNTAGQSVSATSPIQSVPLNIPPGLSPGETKRFIEAHIAQLKAA